MPKFDFKIIVYQAKKQKYKIHTFFSLTTSSLIINGTSGKINKNIPLYIWVTFPYF